MKQPHILLILLVASLSLIEAIQEQDVNEVAEETNDAVDANLEASQAQMITMFDAFIEHYKQEDPVGMPVNIVDPTPVPNVSKSLGMAQMELKNGHAHGISKFRLGTINMDIKNMKAVAVAHLDELVVKGDYVMSSFFSRANGPYSIVLKKVSVTCLISLTVERDGRLSVDRTDMDIVFGELAMDFQNLGFFGSIFQGVVNSAPNLVFDAMKPFMVAEADKAIRTEVNGLIEKEFGELRLPNSITPLDSLIAKGRNMVRHSGCDPLRVPDMNRTMGVFSVHLSNTWISGVSSFYRVGNVSLGMANNTVWMRLQLGTQQITGAGQWEMGFGLVTRVGHVQFTVQHIRADVAISQPLDTRKRAQINDLQLDMGNIQVRCDGAGTLDYIMEFGVNVLPNLLRYQIMDAIENPIKQRIQEQFNAIDTEQFAKSKILEMNQKPKQVKQEGCFGLKL